MTYATVRNAGASEGLPHVFFHGSPGSSSDWELLAARAGDARLVLVDLPDHGAAEPSEADVERLVDEAERVVRHLDATRLRLVGSSFGGYVVARLLEVLPDRVEKAVFIGAFPGLTDDDAETRRGLLGKLRAGELSSDEVGGICAALLLGAHADEERPRAIVDRMLSRITPEQWDRHLERSIELARPELAASGYVTPAVLLHGVRDSAIPFARGEELARLGRNVEVVALDTDAHALQLTHPDEVSRAVFG